MESQCSHPPASHVVTTITDVCLLLSINGYGVAGGRMGTGSRWKCTRGQIDVSRSSNMMGVKKANMQKPIKSAPPKIKIRLSTFSSNNAKMLRPDSESGEGNSIGT